MSRTSESATAAESATAVIAVEQAELGEEHAELQAQAKRGGAWLAVSALLTKGTQIVLLLALAALLDPTDLGLLAIGTLVFNILLVLQDLGITDVINRSWEHGEKRAEEVARTALSLAFLAACFFVAVIWLIAPLLADAIASPRSTWVVRWMVLPIPLMAISWVQMARMQRDMAFQRRLIPDAVPAVLGAATTIVLLAATDAGIWGMVAGNAVTCIASPLCAMLVGYSVSPGWNKEVVGEILRWGRHSTPASVLTLITLNIDYILVSRWLGAAKLGYYSLAFRISYVPFVLLVTVFNAAAFPYYCRMPGLPQLRRAIEQTLNILSVCVFAMCGAIFLFAPAVELLGEKWAPAEGALRWLAVYAALNAIAHTIQLPLKAAGHVKLFFQAQLIHLGVLAVALVIFVPHGVTAVGMSQAIAAGIVLVISQLMLNRTVGFKWSWLLRANQIPLIATAVMAAVAYALQAAGLAANTWLGIIVMPVVALGAYAGVVWSFSRKNMFESLQVLRGSST